MGLIIRARNRLDLGSYKLAIEDVDMWFDLYGQGENAINQNKASMKDIKVCGVDA